MSRHPMADEKFGFKVGQFVRMLVESSGGDPDGEERSFPVGSLALISGIEHLPDPQGWAFTLLIEGEIVNVFDEGDGLPDEAFFEAVEIQAIETLPGVNLTKDFVTDVEVYIEAAQRHGEDSEPDHEVGDLQDLLRAAWGLLSEEQKMSLFWKDEVRNVLVQGGYIEE